MLALLLLIDRHRRKHYHSHDNEDRHSRDLLFLPHESPPRGLPAQSALMGSPPL